MRPRFTYAYREMALVAENVRKNRAQGDPALVEAGKLSAEDAAARLRISTAISVDWKAYASMELPPLDRTTEVEKVESLTTVLAGAVKRRDHMQAAMIGEYGRAIAALSLSELWAIHDAHDTRSQRILPYLHWESYAAAIEAMLWWQKRPRCQSRRFITMINQELRAFGYAEQQRVAA
jgi:hypothetical protein